MASELGLSYLHAPFSAGQTVDDAMGIASITHKHIGRNT